MFLLSRTTRRFVLLVTVFSLFSCVSKPQINEEFNILTDLNQFIHIINSMENPSGFLPTEFSYYFQKPNIFYKNYGSIVDQRFGNRYYEFFVFDRDSCIIILSIDPLVGIKINSNKFYNHLNMEFSGLLKNQKSNNTLYYYQKVGKYEIGILFAPNEVKRWNVDRRITLIKDLISAAGKITFFSVDMRDETLYNDITNSGKYFVYYPEGIVVPFGGRPIENRIGFSFIIGQQIYLTDSLMTSFRGYSLDPNDLKKDFFICFTSPIGKDSGSVYDGNYFKPNEGNYSIVLVIKGDLYDKIFPFLSSRGIKIETFNLKVEFENGPMILWDKRRFVDIYYSTDGTSYNFLSSYDGLSYSFSFSPGFLYFVKVVDKNSGEEALISFVYPKSPDYGDLKITEVLWMGSTDGVSNFTADEFIEIKNVSGKYLKIDSINLYVNNNLQIGSELFNSLSKDFKILTPNDYFLIINDKDHIFSPSAFNLDVVGVKHIASTSLMIPNTFPYYIEIRDNRSITIDSLYVTGSYGYNRSGLKKSMVLKNSGWATSNYTSFDNIFSPYTYCTPGFRYEDEF